MTKSHEETRLLLVDDETEFLEAVRPGLVRRGFLVKTAESGQAALNLLSSEKFDVIVLDVKMPGIDGIDTFMEIKRIAPLLPVIILTGHGNIDQAFETSREGVFEYLTKPCDVATLAAMARQASEQAGPRRNAQDGTNPEIRLLLVDDDRDFLNSIRIPLERRGVIVSVAHDSSAALRHASEQELHVAMIDMVMPGMDGLLLLKQLRKINPLLEVIVLTGHPSIPDVRQSLKDGAFDFLTKPQSVEELLRKIRAAYEHGQQMMLGEQSRKVDQILSDMPD